MPGAELQYQQSRQTIKLADWKEGWVMHPPRCVNLYPGEIEQITTFARRLVEKRAGQNVVNGIPGLVEVQLMIYAAVTEFTDSAEPPQ